MQGMLIGDAWHIFPLDNFRALSLWRYIARDFIDPIRHLAGGELANKKLFIPNDVSIGVVI